MRKNHQQNPTAIKASDIPIHTQPSLYPEPYASKMKGRVKRRLGDFFGLKNFGINQTTLEPGAMSALRHCHSRQDELIYVLQGEPTLYTDTEKLQLKPGMCAGFAAAGGNANHLVNETAEMVVYLEIGDRTPGDSAEYPDDDLQAKMMQGTWVFLHKDGSPY